MCRVSVRVWTQVMTCQIGPGTDPDSPVYARTSRSVTPGHLEQELFDLRETRKTPGEPTHCPDRNRGPRPGCILPDILGECKQKGCNQIVDKGFPP